MTHPPASARTGPARAGLLLACIALLAVATRCTQGRETRLLEVLNRSRAAPERIIELESPYLDDSDVDVRALAVWAIGDSGAPGAAAAISPLAEDKEDAVRLAVAKALCAMTFATGASTVPTAGSIPAGAAGVGAPSASAPGSVATQAGATGEGDHSGPKPSMAVEILTRLATDRDVMTRRVAVRCLSFDPATDPQVLNRALEDTDENVRRTILTLLVERPRPGTLPGLVAAVRLRSPEDRIVAAKALRALKDPEALPALESIASEHLPSGVRDVVEPTILELRAAKILADKAKADAAKAEAQQGTRAPEDETGKPSAEEGSDE